MGFAEPALAETRRSLPDLKQAPAGGRSSPASAQDRDPAKEGRRHSSLSPSSVSAVETIRPRGPDDRIRRRNSPCWKGISRDAKPTSPLRSRLGRRR